MDREQRLATTSGIGGERAKKYPLLLVSNHGRWRTHAQNDDITWQREIRTCKVKGWDGYLYEPIWINPEDAEARGIKDGDIVKLFNERGSGPGRRLRVGDGSCPVRSPWTTEPGPT